MQRRADIPSRPARAAARWPNAHLAPHLSFSNACRAQYDRQQDAPDHRAPHEAIQPPVPALLHVQEKFGYQSGQRFEDHDVLQKSSLFVQTATGRLVEAP